MGGGDLNMKKSWHPVLLVNQERVWKAEKASNEEKKKLEQLRKERDEERQLAELQRMQEEKTGKKKVAKLDWMYQAPSTSDGAMGGGRSEKEMEEYLLGKRRVDEVLAHSDKNIGASHKDFIAVQNANTARDTASKIREDPMLEMKRQQMASMQALMNRPDVRRQIKEAQKEKSRAKEEKEARRAQRQAIREERRARKEGKRIKHDDDDDHSRSRSDSDDERRYKRSRSDSDDERRYMHDKRDYERDGDRSRNGRDGRNSRDGYDRNDRGRRYHDRDESRSPREYRRDDRDRRERDRYAPYSRPPAPTNGHSSSHRPAQPHPSRPSALDLADRPTSSRPAPTNGANGNGSAASLDEQRAARLAAMTASADALHSERSTNLARRAEEERIQLEKEEKARARYGKDEAASLFMKNQEKMSGSMGLSESLQRRAGKGLLKDI